MVWQCTRALQPSVDASRRNRVRAQEAGRQPNLADTTIWISRKPSGYIPSYNLDNDSPAARFSIGYGETAGLLYNMTAYADVQAAEEA